MRTPILQQIDLWIRSKYAFIMCLICVVLPFIPLQISFISIKPNLLIAAVYFWSINKPEDLGMVKVFLLGIFVDILEGDLLGINILMLLTTYVIANKLRRFIFGKPFIISLAGLLIISLGTFVLEWFFISLNQNNFININFILLSYIITAAFYPIVALIGAKINNASLKD
ncbi:MAG: rod shape-determining protein MreD [Alphaproteobacteria bacterium]